MIDYYMKKSNIYILLILWLLNACVATQNISNNFMENDLNTINPSFKIYHSNEFISTIFYEFNSSELLYTRESKKSLFQSKVKLKYSVFEEGSKTAIDTGSVIIIDEVVDVKNEHIEGFIEFDFPFQKKGYVKLEARDENRGRSVKFFNYIDKLNDYNEQFFLVKDSLQNTIYNNYISNEKEITILSYFNAKKSLSANHNSTYFPLANPPFSKNYKPSFDFKTSNSKVLSKNSSSCFNYKLPGFGLIHFQLDTNTKNGFTLFQFYDHFPRIKTTEEMIHPIRFICTKEEFENIRNSSNSKKAIDDFWLKKGNTTDISRELIKKYYSRVEKANLYFTSHKEGWKTDRGMISIIFGPPKLVRKTTNSIVWNYGDENNMNSITFTFERINNPFSNNDYQLTRNYNFKNPWYRAVDAWRNGKAFWIQ
jgi:GWxTD domain-containing protein